LAAAIPHALLLLHALLDILPYPQGDKGMWYEIRTGSTECIEEVTPKVGGKGKGKGKDKAEVVMEDAEEIEFGDIGGIEEDEPERISKLKVSTILGERGVADSKASMEIDLHIGPKRKQGASTTIGPPTMKIAKRSRPGRKKREALKRQAGSADEEEEEEGGEEEAMNFASSIPRMRVERDMSPEEEEEELENR
jgi:hypothetical protein